MNINEIKNVYMNLFEVIKKNDTENDTRKENGEELLDAESIIRLIKERYTGSYPDFYKTVDFQAITKDYCFYEKLS